MPRGDALRPGMGRMGGFHPGFRRFSPQHLRAFWNMMRYLHSMSPYGWRDFHGQMTGAGLPGLGGGAPWGGMGDMMGSLGGGMGGGLGGGSPQLASQVANLDPLAPAPPGMRWGDWQRVNAPAGGAPAPASGPGAAVGGTAGDLGKAASGLVGGTPPPPAADTPGAGAGDPGEGAEETG